MQLIPPTANRVAGELGVADFETEPAVRSRDQHPLRHLLPALAGGALGRLAAAGDRVLQRRAGGRAALDATNGHGADPDVFVDSVPYGETRRYLRRVLRSYRIYQLLYGRGAGAARVRPLKARPRPADSARHGQGDPVPAGPGDRVWPAAGYYNYQRNAAMDADLQEPRPYRALADTRTSRRLIASVRRRTSRAPRAASPRRRSGAVAIDASGLERRRRQGAGLRGFQRDNERWKNAARRGHGAGEALLAGAARTRSSSATKDLDADGPRIKRRV